MKNIFLNGFSFKNVKLPPLEKTLSIKKVFLITACVMLLGCGVSKTISVARYYPPTEEHIELYQAGQNLPQNINRIGSIVIGDTGFTLDSKCTYEVCINLIETEARKVGAQIAYIVHVKAPDSHSTCYNITADLYRYNE